MLDRDQTSQLQPNPLQVTLPFLVGFVVAFACHLRDPTTYCQQERNLLFHGYHGRRLLRCHHRLLCPHCLRSPQTTPIHKSQSSWSRKTVCTARRSRTARHCHNCNRDCSFYSLLVPHFVPSLCKRGKELWPSLQLGAYFSTLQLGHESLDLLLQNPRIPCSVQKVILQMPMGHSQDCGGSRCHDTYEWVRHRQSEYDLRSSTGCCVACFQRRDCTLDIVDSLVRQPGGPTRVVQGSFY